jgi:hypothetical protein
VSIQGLRLGQYTDPLAPGLTFDISRREPWWHRLLLLHKSLIWDGPIIRGKDYYYLRACSACFRAWWIE